MALKSIKPLDCQRFLNDLYNEGYAKATIKKYLTTLRLAFIRAETDGLIKESPLKNLIIPKAPTKKISALSAEEQVVIEMYCKDTLYGDFIIFLLNTGLRVGEMLNLQWSDFDEKNRTVFIRKSKTESGVRELPLVNKAFDIIKKQKKSEHDNYIFHNIHGAPLTYNCMKRSVKELREKSRYYNFTLHSCRHSFATRLTEAGANPKGVAGALGHKKVEYALNIYTDLEIKTLKNDVLLLDKETAKDNPSAMEIALAVCVRFIKKQYGEELPEEIKKIFEQLNIKEEPV